MLAEPELIEGFGLSSDQDFEYRFNAVDILNADTISDQVQTINKQSKKEPFVLFYGKGHEEGIEDTDNIKISHLLNIEGLNVIVVNSSQKK